MWLGEMIFPSPYVSPQLKAEYINSFEQCYCCKRWGYLGSGGWEPHMFGGWLCDLCGAYDYGEYLEVCKTHKRILAYNTAVNFRVEC